MTYGEIHDSNVHKVSILYRGRVFLIAYIHPIDVIVMHQINEIFHSCGQALRAIMHVKMLVK
jgi:hypothetical protein